jgi:hypothetical protein
MIYNYKEILSWKFPSCDFIMEDANNYDTLVWNDLSEKPSKEFLEKKIDLIKEGQLISIRYLRAKEYSKLNQDEMRFDDLINGTNTWRDAILEIKAKFPKPE